MKRKNEDDTEVPIKKQKSLSDVSNLVASLIERLKEEQNVTSGLKEFVKCCQTEEDNVVFVTLYLKNSPECKDLFGLFEIGGKPEPDILELIWEAFEGILSVTSQNKNEKLLHSSGVFLINKLLQAHMKLLYSSLSTASKDSLVKSAFKLMTYMIAQDKQLLRDFALTFDFSLKGFRAAASRRNRKIKPDVRTCFLRFCLAFFAFGDSSIIIKLLEEKGLGALILNDLYQDSMESILAVLQTLKTRVIQDEKILKKTKLQFFNPSVISKITSLCKNPIEDIRNSALNFVTLLTTDTKCGICFFPKEKESIMKLINPSLLKFLQLMKGSLLSDETLRSLAINILQKSRDVIVPFMSSLNLQMEVRSSESWFTNMDFIIELWEKLPVVSKVNEEEKQNVLKNFGFWLKFAIPPTIKKDQLVSALKSKHVKVQRIALKLLEIIMKKSINLKNQLLLSNLESDVIDSKISEILQGLPEVNHLITLRQNVVLKKNEDGKSSEQPVVSKEGDEVFPTVTAEDCSLLLSSSTKILHQYQEVRGGLITDSGFNICKLLLAGSVAGVASNVNVVFDILLLENNDNTRMWLEKKLPGGVNIIQLVLDTIINFPSCKDKGKRVLFKVLNSVECLQDYVIETDIWISTLLSIGCNQEGDINRFFSNALFKLLNDPYKLQQNLKSVLKIEYGTDSLDEQPKENEFTPLTMILMQTFKKTTVSEESYNFVQLACKQLLLCQEDPVPLVKLLLKESSDNEEKYSGLLSFAKRLLSGLKLNDPVLEKVFGNISDEPQTGVSFEFLDAIEILLQSSGSKSKSEVKKQLKNFSDLLQNKTEIFNKISSLTKSKILCSILMILSSFEITEKNTEVLCKVLTQIHGHIENCLAETENANLCSSNFINIHNSNLSSKKIAVWKNFNSKMLAFCLKINNCGVAVEELVNQIVTSIQSSKLSPYFECIAVYLNENAAIKTFKALVELIFTKDFEELQQNVINMTNKALDTLPTSTSASNLKTILTEQNLFNLFSYSLENDNESLVELCYRFYLMSPTSNLLPNSNEKDNGRIIKKLVSSVNQQQFRKKICQILIKSDASLRRLFIQMIADDDEIALQKDHHEDLCSLVYVALKLSGSPENLPNEFIVRITQSWWSQLLSFGTSVSPSGLKVLIETSSLQSPEIIEKSSDEILSLLIQESSSLDKDVLTTSLEFVYENTPKDAANNKQTIKIIGHLVQIFLNLKGYEFKDKQTDVVKSLVSVIKCLDSYNGGDDDETAVIQLKRNHILVGLWKLFVVEILKNHFMDVDFIELLEISIRCFYKGGIGKKSGVSLKDLHDMVVGHSKFLTVLIDENNEHILSKDALVTLLHTITKRCADVCNFAFTSVLYMAYNGRLTKRDQNILSLLKLYEENQCLNQFPTSWGAQAIDAYKTKNAEATSLMKEVSSYRILSNLDSKFTFKTAINFPVNLKLLENDFTLDKDEEMYDPRFLLLLFSCILRPGNNVDCKHFLESNCLAVTIASLTSHDVSIRKLAYLVLAQYNDYLESASFREKAQLDYMLMMLKHSIFEEHMMLPSVWAVFVIRYISLLSHPDQHLYSELNHQLLRKPIMYIKDIPFLFMQFFHSNSVEHQYERAWALKLLFNGLKDDHSYYMYKRNQVFELAMSSYDSVISDKKSKALALDLIHRACTTNNGTFDLVKQHGLLAWLSFQLAKSVNSDEKGKLIDILHTTTCTLENHEKEVKGTTKPPVPRILPSEMLTICLNCMVDLKTISQVSLEKLIKITDWVLRLPCHFGDMISKMESSEKSLLMKTCQTLMVTCPEKNLYESFGYFKRILLKTLEKPNTVNDFEDVSWKCINERLSKCVSANINDAKQKIGEEILDILEICKTEHFEMDFFMDILNFTL